MNIHPSSSSYNLQETSRICPKLNSPSYSKTTQTLCSSSIKSIKASRATAGNHSQEIIKNTQQNSKEIMRRKPQAKQQQTNPFLIIDDIKWNNDLAFFTSDMNLKIQYTVTKKLEENISWQITYLGSAYSEKNDQVLIQFETEENQKSSSFPEKRQFKLTVQPPKWDLISPQEVFSITAITISASYKLQEFVKIGYYVHYQMPALSQMEKKYIQRLEKQQHTIEKQDKRKNISKKKKITKKALKKTLSTSESCNRESSGSILQEVLQRTVRTILGDKPRITKFPIDWQTQQLNSNLMKIQIQGESTDLLQNQHLITKYMNPQGSMLI